jgi:hypothetical protein
MIFKHRGKDVKRCSNCGSVFDVEEFRPCRSTKDGRQYYCRECHKPKQTLKRRSKQEKVCLICGKRHSYTEYSPANNTVDGLADVCNVCILERLKVCKSCGELKPLSEYYEARGPEYPDGRFHICKTCDLPGQRRIKPPSVTHYSKYFATQNNIPI